MLEAEQWYQHQQEYQKYGLDMKPRQPRQARQRRSALTPKDKARILMLMALVGILCVGLIIASAYAASIQYDINKQIKANHALSAELGSLEVKIQTTTNLMTIEKKARKELGMVPSKKGQVLYISTGTNTEKKGDKKGEKAAKTAVTTKDKAYN